MVYIPFRRSSTRQFIHWYIYHSELKQNALIKWYIYHRKNQSKGGIYSFRILSTRLFNHWYIYHSELKQNALITWYIYHRKNQSKGGIYTRLVCSVTGIYTILSLNRMRSQSDTYTIARNNPKLVYIPFKVGVYTSSAIINSSVQSLVYIPL